MRRQDVAMLLSQKIAWVLGTYLKGEIEIFNETYHPSGNFSMPEPQSFNQTPSASVGVASLYPQVRVFPVGSSVSYDSANVTHGLQSTYSIVTVFDRLGYNEDYNMTHCQSMCSIVGSILEEHLPEAGDNAACYVVDGSSVTTKAVRLNNNRDVIVSTSQIVAYSRPSLLHKPTITPTLAHEPYNATIATQTTTTLSVTDDSGNTSLTVTNGMTVDLSGFTNITGLSISGEHTSVDSIMVVNQTQLESLKADYASGTDDYNFSPIPRNDGDILTVSWLANNGLIFSFKLN
jgi:hypothetical protein